MYLTLPVHHDDVGRKKMSKCRTSHRYSAGRNGQVAPCFCTDADRQLRSCGESKNRSKLDFPGQQWTRSLTINASPSSSIVAKKVTKCARHGMDMYFNMSNAHLYAVGIMLLQPFKVWLTRRNIQRSHIRIHISLTSARSFSRVSVQCNVCR